MLAAILLLVAAAAFTEICSVERTWNGKKGYNAVYDFGNGKVETQQINPFSMVDFLNMMEQKGWTLERTLYVSDSKFVFLFKKQ